MTDVTRILSQIEQGDPQAAEQLLPLVYDELRKLAAARLAQEKPGQTLQATALVHEAYLRLVGGGERSGFRVQGSEGEVRSEVRGRRSDEAEPTSDLRPPTSSRWNSRGHFFAAAAEAMRRILVDSAKRKRSAKRGGQAERVALGDDQIASPSPAVDLVALNDALNALAAHDSRKAELVNLRFFAGLTIRQAAEALGISESTADADWAYAKSWLRVRMAD
jgi:RNA polymerase sigma factor (sigma-70 family)